MLEEAGYIAFIDPKDGIQPHRFVISKSQPKEIIVVSEQNILVGDNYLHKGKIYKRTDESAIFLKTMKTARRILAFPEEIPTNVYEAVVTNKRKEGDLVSVIRDRENVNIDFLQKNSIECWKTGELIFANLDIPAHSPLGDCNRLMMKGSRLVKSTGKKKFQKLLADGYVAVIPFVVCDDLVLPNENASVLTDDCFVVEVRSNVDATNSRILSGIGLCKKIVVMNDLISPETLNTIKTTANRKHIVVVKVKNSNIVVGDHFIKIASPVIEHGHAVISFTGTEDTMKLVEARNTAYNIYASLTPNPSAKEFAIQWHKHKPNITIN